MNPVQDGRVMDPIGEPQVFPGMFHRQACLRLIDLICLSVRWAFANFSQFNETKTCFVDFSGMAQRYRAQVIYPTQQARFEARADRIHRVAADSKSASSIRSLPQSLLNFQFCII